MLTNRIKAELAGGALALALGVLGFRSWIGEHDARMAAETTVKVQKADFDKAAQQSRDLQAQEASRDAARDQAVAAIAGSAAKAVTPAEIADWIPRQLAGLSPGAPQPITITIPPPTAQNPQPNATASIPQADLPALRDTIAKCQECAIKLAAAQSDLTSRDERLKLAGQQLSDVERQRDAYKQELKGGTFWTRTKRALKFIAIGAAAGAAAVCGSGHCK